MKPLKVKSLDVLTQESQNYAALRDIRIEHIADQYINYQQARYKKSSEIELSADQLATGIIIATELVHHQEIKLPKKKNAFQTDYITITRDKPLSYYESLRKQYEKTFNEIAKEQQVAKFNG